MAGVDSPLDLRSLAIRALVAAASAIGFLGFVAALGGAIMWVRFYAAEIPADQAVAVLPKNELVSFGAVSLAIFLVLGAVAAAAAYLIEPGGGVSLPMRVGLLVLIVTEMALAIWVSPLDSDRKVGLTLVIAAASVVLAVSAWLPETERGRQRRQSWTAVQRERETQRRRWVTYAQVALLIGLVSVLAAPEYWIGIGLLVAALLGRACMRVASLTSERAHPFVWYGVAVFIAVVFFGGVLTAIRALFTPQVQPAAVLRQGDPIGVCGFYVTETDKRIYLARSDLKNPRDVRPEDNTGRIFWIPRDKVTAVAIGRFQSVRNAQRRAPLLRDELIAERLAESRSIEEATETSTERTKGTEKVIEKSSRKGAVTEDPPPKSVERPERCTATDL